MLDKRIVSVVVSDTTGAVSQEDLRTVCVFTLDKVISEQVGYAISDFTGILPTDSAYKSIVKIFAQNPGQKVVLKGILASTTADIQPALSSMTNKFFFVVTYGATAQYAKEISDWCTANYKLYMCTVEDATGTVSIPYVEELNSEASAVFATSKQQDIGAGIAGWLAPKGAGSGAFAYKRLNTFATEGYTPTIEANLENNNVNFMTRLMGLNVLFGGTSTAGTLLHLTWEKYWLVNKITEEVTRARIFNDKLEYDLTGLAIIKDAITKVLNMALDGGILRSNPEELDDVGRPVSVPSFTVNAPNLATATPEMRAKGLLPPFRVIAYLSQDIMKPIEIQLTTTL